MTSYLGLYVLINIFCILIVLIIALHSKLGTGNMVPQRRFFAALVTLLVFFITDTIWYAMDCKAIPQIWSISVFLKTIYFLSATLASYIWFLYMSNLTKNEYLDSKNKVALFAIPVFIHLVLAIINLFNGILFKIDENFVYSRGPLFSIQYVFVYIYLITSSLYAVYKAMKPENYVERLRYLMIASFPIFPLISGTLQIFYWRIPFNCIAFTLGIIIVYLTESYQQISQEPLTGLMNRISLMRTIEQYKTNHEEDGKLYLFMIDIDRFKPINDNYGHIEGDQAIINTGEALKKATQNLHRKSALARFGGDEFAIVAILENENDVELLKTSIQSEIDKMNQTNQKQYSISLSIGIANYTKDFSSIRDLLIAADAELYKNKNSK